MTSGGDERRSTQRHLERLNVTYSLLVSQGATPIVFEDTRTLDISRTGVRVMVRDSVEEGMLIQLCIRIPALRNPILMVGKVRWIKPREGGSEIGIQFIGQLPPKLDELISKIQSLRGAEGMRAPEARLKRRRH